MVVAGLSAGASMAALLACQHAARFVAVAMHSGVPPGRARSTLGALSAMRGGGDPAAPPGAPAGPWPPLLVIHGDADRVVSVANGRAAAQLWAVAAGAQARNPRVLQRGQRRALQITDFYAGRRLCVQCVEVVGLGHAWSGGDGRLPFGDARGPDANGLLWAFAKRFWT